MRKNPFDNPDARRNIQSFLATRDIGRWAGTNRDFRAALNEDLVKRKADHMARLHVLRLKAAIAYDLAAVYDYTDMSLEGDDDKLFLSSPQHARTFISIGDFDRERAVLNMSRESDHSLGLWWNDDKRNMLLVRTIEDWEQNGPAFMALSFH